MSDKQLSVAEQNYLAKRNEGVLPQGSASTTAANALAARRATEAGSAGTATNAAQLEGKTWEAPGELGSGTPNKVHATTLSTTGVSTLGDDAVMPKTWELYR